MLTLMWLDARKNGLIDKTLKIIEIQNISLQSVLAPVVFTISILISIANIQIAYYFWLIIISAKIMIHKKYP